MPEDSLESNTLYTINIHLNHIQRLLGEMVVVERLKYADLQSYVDKRSKEDGRRGKQVSPVTIRKELTSFNGVWAWGLRVGIVKGVFPNKGLRFAKTTDKSPFQIWAEIERQIDFGGLTDVEIAELWEGLFLTMWVSFFLRS